MCTKRWSGMRYTPAAETAMVMVAAPNMCCSINPSGTSLTIDNLIGLVVEKGDDWTKFQPLCNIIMKTRLAQEKIDERRRRR